jgi:hypothetical protein
VQGCVARRSVPLSLLVRARDVARPTTNQSPDSLPKINLDMNFYLPASLPVLLYPGKLKSSNSLYLFQLQLRIQTGNIVNSNSRQIIKCEARRTRDLAFHSLVFSLIQISWIPNAIKLDKVTVPTV